MSKYGHRPHDWFEAIVNKLGGEEAAENFLRGELGVTPAVKPAFPIWKTLNLDHPQTAKAYRAALSANGYYVGSYADELLEKMKIAGIETEANLVQVTVKDLGFKNLATYDEIVSRAKDLGLDLCPAEVGPKLRLEHANQSNGEWLTIAMEPIVDSSGYARVFCVDRGLGGRWLVTDCVGSGHRWDLDNRFVFLSRK